MSKQDDTPEVIQARYYSDTASHYNSMHNADTGDEHYESLRLIEALSKQHGFATFLDVGAGTGRGVRFLLEKGWHVRGVEPVQALIDIAEATGIPSGIILNDSGYILPFEDNSFDVVVEFGVLHHVQNPSLMVSEMTRVARRAVFLSDSNRFGQGVMWFRWLKLVLFKIRLWNLARFVQTKGKMYSISIEDGLYYSYSVFDSYEQLAKWADSLFCISTDPRCYLNSWFNPLITSASVLLCALKKNSPS